MLVRFKVNLGSLDAEPLGLDFHKCQEGMEVECSDKSAAWLLAKNIAEEVKVLKGVSAPPSIASAKSPDIKADSKPARKHSTLDKDS